MDSAKAKVFAFVHAKGTSERVPGKNLADLGGKPLVAYAMRAAQLSQVDHAYLDTDSHAICEAALHTETFRPFTRLRRPSALSSNAASGDDLALEQARVSGMSKHDVLVQVLPTSPFIRPETIDAAVWWVLHGGYDSAAAVRMEHLYTWICGTPDYYWSGYLPNSQELSPTTYETTGLYAVRVGALRKHKHRVCGRSKAIPVSRIEAVDINTPEDLEFARIVWAGMRDTQR